VEALPTVLLTGVPGSGKTAIAKEIGELLRRADVRYAVVDLDALGEVGPPCNSGTFNSPLIAENLAAMWPNYRAHGIDRLVLARVIAGAEEIAALRSAVPEADIRIGRVLAPVRTVIERLRMRETGVKRGFLLRIAPGLGDELSRLRLEDFTVDNGAGRSVTTVALEVLDKLGWPVPISPMSEDPQVQPT
jgi:dephospho-CoA kinase